MKNLKTVAIQIILASNPTPENDAQYKESWMTDEVIKVVKKISSSPYRDLYNSIRETRPYSTLCTYLAMDLVSREEYNTPIYFEVRKILLERLLYLDPVLADARDALYRENLKKEALARVSQVIEVPHEPSVFDKEDLILTEDELLEEAASFWPEDDMLQNQLKKRKAARWRAEYRKRMGWE